MSPTTSIFTAVIKLVTNLDSRTPAKSRTVQAADMRDAGKLIQSTGLRRDNKKESEALLSNQSRQRYREDVARLEDTCRVMKNFRAHLQKKNQELEEALAKAMKLIEAHNATVTE